MHARLASLLGLILTLTLPAHAARIDELLARAEFKAAQPLAQKLLAKDSPTADERAQLYAWLFDSDDLATLDRRLRVTLTGADISAVDQQAAGRLALEARDFERAQAAFKQAEALATSSAERAAALKGQGQIAYQKRDYDNAIKLEEASTALKADADALLAQAETLIRLGRTADAITALERAIQLNPLHEQAHYFLGNGYARKNYSELKAQNPAAFKQAMALVHRASDAFDRGQYQAARRLSQQALLRCPQLGRAHAVLAKALEFERMAIDVHRAAAEARFAAQAMPVVPGIEQYVSNWASLSKRHQKRVALSVAPWAAFIPILVEGGARHSIKPLGMLLSETPEAKGLRDARIDYDSRLWDDVRGMGGYNTVTGIEDVERSVFDRYNTVLHELTHQVHGVLTAEQSREIQELYRRAKERDVAAKSTGRSAFLSRYAGGSVWEYFAEGANSFESPRRDAFDHREIVRERLVEMDPELQALVRRLFTLKDTRASLPVALVGAGDHALGE
ncbi:MAG TPA: tetratricopeptide repeat protein, partial [Burkholderiaceae bacterium]